jgi:hypothetical protein
MIESCKPVKLIGLNEIDVLVSPLISSSFSLLLGETSNCGEVSFF